MKTAERLASVYSLEALRRLELAASAALDLAKGRAVLPARRRLWSFSDAVDIALKRSKQSHTPG